MNKIRLLLGIVVIGVGFFLPYIEEAINNEPSVVEVLNIQKPDQLYVEYTKSVDNITDKKDRESLAIFSYEFANRIPKYETDVQTYNNIYKDAGQQVYGTSIANKYNDGLIGKDLFIKVLGDQNGFVTEEQKKDLSNYFMSNAWVLGGGIDE